MLLQNDVYEDIEVAVSDNGPSYDNAVMSQEQLNADRRHERRIRRNEDNIALDTIETVDG